MPTPQMPTPPQNIGFNSPHPATSLNPIRSSPIRVDNGDYLQLLAEYMNWQITRTPSAREELQRCLDGFIEEGVGLDDVQRYTSADWEG